MIEIVPFGNIGMRLLKDLCTELGNTFRFCKICETVLGVPKNAYNARRRQYNSILFLESLLEYSKISRADKILGVTDEDMFSHGLNFIFGHAYVGGRACLISLCRLHSREYSLFLERAVKEAVHELGHCYAMQHCSNASCVMVFSNSIMDVDKNTKYFCE